MSFSPTDTATGRLVDVTMPQMGVSVAEGTVVAWRFGVGEQVRADETICEISTDKIDTEVPSPASGVLAEILVACDQAVAVGTVLARIATDARVPSGAAPGAPSGAAPGAPSGATPGAPSETALGGRPEPVPDAPARSSPDAPDLAPAGGGHRANGHAGDGSRAAQRQRYSPVVSRIAAEHGINLAHVPGSGRGGRVRKQDVLAYISRSARAPSAEEPPLHIESPYRPEPVPAAAGGASPPAPGGSAPGTLSRMRRQIGEHMKRSLQTAATCTTWIEADMSAVESARRRLGVTALAFVARACIDALREHQALNATLEGELYTRHRAVHLGIAVSLGEDGLIVPVIRDAHELAVEGLAARIRELARRARAGQLSPDDVRGGTFTITNPGQFGSIMATPVINQPQVAILDLEAIVKRPVVVTDSRGQDAIAVRAMTILGLSWDHRALDGAQAAQFLSAVRSHLEAVSP